VMLVMTAMLVTTVVSVPVGLWLFGFVFVWGVVVWVVVV
jgi:hypothetical protein